MGIARIILIFWDYAGIVSRYHKKKLNNFGSLFASGSLEQALLFYIIPCHS